MEYLANFVHGNPRAYCGFRNWAVVFAGAAAEAVAVEVFVRWRTVFSRADVLADFAAVADFRECDSEQSPGIEHFPVESGFPFPTGTRASLFHLFGRVFPVPERSHCSAVTEPAYFVARSHRFDESEMTLRKTVSGSSE